MSAPLPITVRPNCHFPIQSRHPWVHVQSLVTPVPEPDAGTEVDLYHSNGRWLARGIYNPASRIRVRLFTWDAAQRLNADFFRQRIREALRRRDPLQLAGPQQAVRLIYSEGDGLSGLIVDRYGSYLVAQVTSAAMEKQLPAVVETLQAELAPTAILARVDAATSKQEGLVAEERVLCGTAPEAPILIEENGLMFAVDLRAGQKTGLYLDQRDNRIAAARYLRDRRVLDICSYVGGFALTAAKVGQAREVVGVDSSAWAVAAATENAARNELTNVRFESADFFEALEMKQKQGEQFDAVILDPPRFASTRQNVDGALRAYHRLNRAAVDLLPPGGILVTCSCSGRVTRPDFLSMLVDVGRKSGRDLIILESRTAAPDHPVRSSCPETDYLKCVIAEVR